MLGSGSDSVLALAASHSFSSFPSYAHVCAVSEKPPSSETPEDMRPIDPRECKLVNEKKNLLYFKHGQVYNCTCSLYTKDRCAHITCSSSSRSPHSADSNSSFPF